MTQENKPTYEELEKELKKLRADTNRQTRYLESNIIMIAAKLSEICIDKEFPFYFKMVENTRK